MDKSLPKAPKKYRFGICAMKKKVEASPMKMLIERIDPYFEIVKFSEEMILHSPIENWPIVDVLMSWHSKGFPLDKAIEYVSLQDILKVNAMNGGFNTYVFFDRRSIQKLLKENGIRVPENLIVERDENGAVKGSFEEHDEYICLDGHKLEKPFVEKPVDAEDHRVRIYYSRVDGGGMKELYRKESDQSSTYYPEVSTIRKDGSYIYEKFLQTEGTDVKVYSVGVSYVHAEARKSPTVDGKVDRDENGKEIRYPILLSYDEKLLCRKIATIFRQTICGFDLLRDRGSSYVCDVNGVSFVKKNGKFWNDAAHLITLIVYKNLCPQVLRRVDTEELEMSSREKQQLEDERNGIPHETENKEVLRAVICVCRHGDRTPKQKLKFKVNSRSLLEKLESLGNDARKEIKIKEAAQLNYVVSAVKEEIKEMNMHSISSSDSTEKRGPPDVNLSPSVNETGTAQKKDQMVVLKNKLLQLIAVLQAGGQFRGFNRKIQIRPILWDEAYDETAKTNKNIDESEYLASQPVVSGKTSCTVSPDMKGLCSSCLDSSFTLLNEKQGNSLPSAYDANADRSLPPVVNGTFELGRGVETTIKKQDEKDQSMPRVNNNSMSGGDENTRVKYQMTEALFIVKWGGVLTQAGRNQASALGKRFRAAIYGGDAFFLRLHNTYRHDMKIYSSEEGRVRTTAAAFIKGCLDVESKHLTPIMVSMVHCHRQADYMLDNTSIAMEMLNNTKRRLYSTLMEEGDMTEERRKRLCPAGGTSILRALEQVKNSYDFLCSIYNDIKSLTKSLFEYGMTAEGKVITGYEEETLNMLLSRWLKLQKDFFDEKTRKFDLSKIPTLYDCIKYDCIHNSNFPLETKLRLFKNAKILADIIVPQEYGMFTWEKMLIGRNIVKNLLIKIDVDLRISAFGPTSKFIEKSDHLREVSSYKADKRYVEEEDFTLKTVYTRMYFTSESHIHGILNVLRYGVSSSGLSAVSEEGQKALNDVSEYDYLSHILLRMYENESYDINDPKRFRVELLFSPGCIIDNVETCGSEPPCVNEIVLHSNLTLQELQSILGHVLNDDDQFIKNSYDDTLDCDRT